MDIKAYISSGILEQYVLGMTSPAETEEVERLAEKHSVIRAEIEEIRSSLESYAQQFAQAPPPFLKDKIWSAIENKDSGMHNPQPDRASYPAPGEAPVADEAFVQIERAPFWQTYGVAASFILLAVSILANLYLFSKLSKTEYLLSQATEERSRLATELEANQARYASLQTTRALLSNPENRIIQLAAGGDSTDAGIVVFWNQQKDQVALCVVNMPPPPPGRQYQLWAIVDKKPVDAGVFNSREVAVQNMKNISRAQAFAVTLEQEGGSPQPTGTILLVAEV